MRIDPSESVLTGGWVVKHGKVQADETCSRISGLVATHLLKLGTDVTGWDTLYQDPEDGRLWELIYPLSHMHGGGPPELRTISREVAEKKYVGAVRNTKDS